MNSLLKVTNVGLIGKKDVLIFKDINFEIAPGEMVMIAGKANSGKSRLVNILSGIAQPSQGRVERNAMVAVVTQEFTLYKDLSVGENLEFICTIHDTDIKQLGNLLKISGLSRWERNRAGKLPFGIKKMLQVVAGVAQRTPLLLLDEPTVGMDHELIQSFWNIMDQLIQERRGVLIMTAQPEPEAYPTKLFTLTGKGLIPVLDPDISAISTTEGVS